MDRKEGAFSRWPLWRIQLFTDTRHFGFGVIIESGAGFTQFTIHFGFVLFKIVRYWNRFYVARALCIAAYQYEQMLENLKRLPVRWRTGGKRLPKVVIENLERIMENSLKKPRRGHDTTEKKGKMRNRRDSR